MLEQRTEKTTTGLWCMWVRLRTMLLRSAGSHQEYTLQGRNTHGLSSGNKVEVFGYMALAFH